MGINWKNLKNNKQGKNFEALAIEYLKNNFQGNWEPTKQTRDGNKDAISIFYINKEKWAEAKYTNKEKLPRYRLDATIVSAIIKKEKVIEVIFITNSLIDESTKYNIQTALINAMGKSFKVYFKTKRDIEFWLYNNPDIYKKYFLDSGEEISSLESEFNKLIPTSDASFYTLIRQSISFNEPLKLLYVGESYHLRFSIFSPVKDKIEIKINTDKLKIVNNNIVNINKGENSINIKILCINSGELLKSADKKLLNIKGNIDVEQAEDKIEILHSIKLFIKSQKSIYNLLLNSLEDFKIHKNSIIHVIEGEGGIGKSVLIEQLLNSNKFDNLDVIHQEFSIDPTDNKILLINIILSIFFYYLDYETIDDEFLNNLIKENKYISTYLLEFVKAKKNIMGLDENALSKLNEVIQEYSNSKELFPNMIDLNKKVIILDDLHKLDSISRGFLFNLISDINHSKLSCFIILTGRNSFVVNEEYKRFRKENSCNAHNYIFSAEDVCENLRMEKFFIDENIFKYIAEKIKLNVFFVVTLLEYLQNDRNTFNTLNLAARHALINSFTVDNKYESEILATFKNLSSVQSDLLNIVYFSISEVKRGFLKKIYVDIINSMPHLINYKEGVYIPYHDIYQELYKRNYEPISIEAYKKYLNYEISDNDKYRNTLVFCEQENYEEPIDAVEGIIKLSANHKFHSVLYILEPIFNEAADMFNQKNKFSQSIYFQLRFLYAYAVANCNKNKGGKECFEEIYTEIKSRTKEEEYDDEKKINEVLLKTISELINSCFEHLEFDNVDMYSKEYESELNKAIIEGYIEKSNKEKAFGFTLIKEILFLKDLAKDDFNNYEQKFNEMVELCKKNGEIEKIDINKIRYARSILHRDAVNAKRYLNEAVTSLKQRNSVENKWILLGDFEQSFLDFQLIKDPNMKSVKIIHQKLKKDFFNDYRKTSLAVASCYLFLSEKEKTYQYLYEDFFIKREIRPRLKGLRLHLLGLYEYIFNEDTQLAKDYFEQQLELFSPLGDSYKNVIKHNIKIVSSLPAKEVIIRFFRDSTLSENCIYIESRLW